MALVTERNLRQSRKGPFKPFKGKGAESCEARIEATADVSGMRQFSQPATS